MTLLSRISGLVRDIAFASVLGTSAAADAFFVAFRIPNFFRRIFGEGAFSVAFIPVFTEFRHQSSAEITRLFLDHLSARLGLVLLSLTVCGVLVAPTLVALMATGFLQDAEKFELTVDALRLTFPYLFFISYVAMAAGILNTVGRFAAAAATPVLLNFCLIASVLWLVPLTDRPTIALALGVFIAGVVQFFFQLPFLRSEGLMPRPKLRVRHENDRQAVAGSKQVYRLMLPALFGVSVAQINVLVNTWLASFLVTGSVSWLWYSDRLMEFPLGVFGIALATVILPNLSQSHASASPEKFSRLLDWGLRWVVLVVIPATAGLMVLAEPLTITLFHHGDFTEFDVSRTVDSLLAFALGLFWLVLVKILAPGFFARQDTRTPVRIGVVAMAVNIFFSVLLVSSLQHVGLALATSIAAFVNAALLFVFLWRDRVYRPQAGWLAVLARVILATMLMVWVVNYGLPATEVWFHDSILSRGRAPAIMGHGWWSGLWLGGIVAWFASPASGFAGN